MSPRTNRTLWSVAVFAALFFAPLVALADDGGSASDKFSAALAGSGPLVAAGIAFASGLATSATPCVWPMIGITVSVFGAQEAKSRTQGALLSAAFVLGMAVLFTVLGVGAAKSGNDMECRKLKDFQRWVIRRHYHVMPFEDYLQAPDGRRREMHNENRLEFAL